MTDSRFGWAEFYMEFADRLLDHKDDRGELVAKVREVCNSLGYDYLDKSGTADEATGLPDICPFTTMGAFNRGKLRIPNRKKIAIEIGQFLGVKKPVPPYDGSVLDAASQVRAVGRQVQSVHRWQLGSLPA